MSISMSISSISGFCEGNYHRYHVYHVLKGYWNDGRARIHKCCVWAKGSGPNCVVAKHVICSNHSATLVFILQLFNNIFLKYGKLDPIIRIHKVHDFRLEIIQFGSGYLRKGLDVTNFDTLNSIPHTESLSKLVIINEIPKEKINMETAVINKTNEY